ncbi:MAG: flavodoxin domain-containing protein [Anaerolineae bacterium]|jgi:flavodoxin|nr:flavodoxin domain-containing protein [Anaerolineae bacterium]
MTVIFYYSLTGNTKYAAEYLAQKLDVEAVRLIDQKNLDGTAVAKHDYSDLAEDPWGKMADHDKIILMTPVWGFGIVPAMYTFIEKADLSGKSVILGCTSFFGKISSKSPLKQYTAMVEKAGGTVLGDFYVKGGTEKSYSEAKLAAGVEKVLPKIKGM